MFGAFPPFLSCRTPRTCPQGHVFDVRHVLCCSPHAEYYEHALVGMFIVFSVRGTAENMSNIKNMPLRACSWCATREEWSEGKGENAPNTRTRPPRTCSGVRDVPKGRRTRRTPQTDPPGPVCGVQDEGKGRGRAKHQNTPFWACFDVRDVRKGGGTCSR